MMKKVMLFLSCLLLSIGLITAQTSNISGIVVDASGEPVIGVSVVVKGTTVGTITDIDGKFTIGVPTGNKVLVFSQIGLKTKELAPSSNMKVVMDEDQKVLEEVVVTSMGIKRSEKSLPYTVSKVNSEELTRAGSTSLLGGLQGKVAGLKISSAGTPGSSTRILLRGFTSLTGNTQPLIILDGNPLQNLRAGSTNTEYLSNNTDFGNNLNDINPNDIADITVLKGASATALYGSRASNGVIMISTKKGAADSKLKIDYVNNTTFTQVAKLPTFQNRYGQGWSYANSQYENGSWGPKFDGVDRLWGYRVGNEQLYKPYSSQNDNMRDFYDTGVTEDNSITLSGGKDKVTYYLSYNNVYSDGVIPTDEDSYKRNTFSLKGSYTDKYITSSASATYIRKSVKTPSSGQGYSVFNNLIQIPRDFSIVDMKDYTNKFYSVDNWYTPYGIVNPYWSLNEDGNRYKEDRIFGNIDISVKLTDFLTVTWRGSGDVIKGTTKKWTATVESQGLNDITKQDGTVTEQTREDRQINSDFVISLNKQLNDDFNLTALVGQNLNQRTAEQAKTEITSLLIDGFYEVSNSANAPTYTKTYSTRRLMGIFGQVDLGFRDYLYLNLTGRNDWSSTLPKKNQSFFYPAVGVSLLFSELFKEQLSPAISYGKLRVAYGETGNDTDPYAVYDSYTKANVTNPFGDGLKYPFNGAGAYGIYGVQGNPDLKAETSKELELGLELKFFNNRAGLDVTIYNKETHDQIIDVDLPPSSGFISKYVNLGTIRNRGIELSLTGTPVQTKDFEWHTSFNWTLNRSKVMDLNKAGSPYATTAYDIYSFTNGIKFSAVEGESLGIFRGYGTLKDDEGHIVVGSNGIPLQSSTLENFGTSEQKYMIGFNNDFKYKNFALGFNLDFRIGGKMYSRTKGTTYFVGNSIDNIYNDRQPFVVPNSVIQDGTDAQGNPIYVENTTPITQENQNYYWDDMAGLYEEGDLIDKTSIRLSDLRFSYMVPKKVLTGTPLSKVEVSLIGQNLFVWTPKSNKFVDPMVSNFGTGLASEFGEFSSAPSVRNFGFSIKASF